MINNQKTEIGSKNTISNSTITQQNASVINNITQLPRDKKTSVIQLILEGILELDIELQSTVLDTAGYTIQNKINHNNITCYRDAFELYMQESLLIRDRLNFLDNNKEATSSQRLYKFVKRVYMKHCGQSNPDKRIICICDEIKDDLIKSTNISDEELALIPVIVFYVFSKCHIFEKPPIQP